MLLLVLGVLMALPTLAQSFSYNGLNYTVTDAEAKTVKVANNSSVSGDITIPATVSYNRKEYIVAEIGSNAFGGCYGLSAVTIPNSVETIGDYAFYNCSGLTEVIIPKYVTEIGSNAFSGCTGLKKSAYPDTFHYLCPTGEVVAYNPEGSIIKDGCIYDLKKKAIYFASLNLKGDYIIPETVESIGRAAFLGCSGLKSITIPNSVETIGDYAFYGCRGLTEVTIPYSVETIGVDAFAGCTGLTKAIFSSIEHLCSIKFDSDAANPLYYAHHLFIDGNEVSEVVIPSSVTSIGKYAFAGCTGLSAVTIHNSVKTIGAWAFEGCSGLTSLIFNAENCTYCGSEGSPAFPSNIKSLTIGESVKTIPNYAFSGCTGLTEVIIPNSVTEIDYRAFGGCSGLTEVTIPNSVTYIDGSAFAGCTGLTEVIFNAENCNSCGSEGSPAFPSNIKSLTIGESVKTIPNYAFSGCTGLTEVIIPNSVTEIDYRAFGGCSGLTEVTIPNSVTYIGSSAFYGCRGLTEVTIPNSVTEIDGWAFRECRGLTEVTIGNSVTTIGSWAFYDCRGLTEVTIPNSVTEIGSSAFSGCSALTQIVSLAETSPAISADSFDGLYDTTEVIVPDNGLTSYLSSEWSLFSKLKSIGGIEASAFTEDNLKYRISGENSVVLLSSNYGDLSRISIPERVVFNDRFYYVISIAHDAFKDCSQLKSIVLPKRLEIISVHAFSGCTGLTEVTIPNSVISIGSGAFSGCTGLTEVTIGNSVTTIGDYAFSRCTGLTEVTIPNSVISIGSGAFWLCTGLTEVTIGNSVNSIGKYAFDGCTGLTKAEFVSIEALCNINFGDGEANPLYNAHNLYIDGKEVTEVVIPESVKTIGDYAFCGCTGLTKAEFPSIEHLCSINFGNSWANPLYYAHHLFIDGKEVTKVVIPESVEFIGDYAFNGCNRLTELIIPSSVTEIGYRAFEDCRGLTEVTIGNSVKTIGDYAFSGCTGLTEVTIPNSVKTIGAWAFFGCSFSLTSVVIGNSVETIGDYAFAGCSGLKSVTIPNSVTEIGGSAFARCGLTEVTIPNSVTTIGDYAFSRCTGLTEVSIPNSVTYIGSSAFENCYVLTDVTFEDGIEPVALGEHIFNHTSVKNLTIGRNFNSGILESSLSCGGSLNKLTIGNTLTEIPDDAFMDYTNLREVTFGASVETIGNNAFQNCALTEVVLSPATKTIGKNAFKGNNINNVVIGANVTDIGAFAFDCANSFNSVSITAITPPRAKNSTFRYSNCPLYVMPSENDAVKNAYYNTTPCWYRFSGYDLIPIEDVKVEGITSLLFEPGKSVKLEAALSPENASLPYIFWYSTNPEVATIDNYGLVTFHNIKSKDIMEAANNDFANGTLCKIFGETLYANRPKLEIKVTDAPSAIDEIEFEAPYLENGHICGAGVYDLRGVKVGDSIEGVPHGVYILRQGSATKKIAI